MYTILYDNYEIYNPYHRSLYLRDPVFKPAVNSAGSASFILDADHPHLDKLGRMKGTIELRENGTPIFRGRILRDTMDFNGSHSFDVEGALAYLNDSVIPPFDYPSGVSGAPDGSSSSSGTNTVQFFLNWLLTQHNSQVNDNRKIKIGTVTVTDADNYMPIKSEKYVTSMEILKTRLLDKLGGYFVMNYQADGNYLSYYSAPILTNGQKVAYSRNLLDLSRERDGSEIYTAIVPIGEDGLTISSLSNGAIDSDLYKYGTYIYSRAARAEYGKIRRVVEFSGIKTAAGLKNKAIAMLQTGINTSETLELKALDLGLTSAQIQTFRVGRNVIFESSPHGLELTLPLMEMTLDLLNPEKTTVTLGQSVKTFTGAAVKNG